MLTAIGSHVLTPCEPADRALAWTLPSIERVAATAGRARRVILQGWRIHGATPLPRLAARPGGSDDALPARAMPYFLPIVRR
jgi:hypothetical protein